MPPIRHPRLALIDALGNDGVGVGQIVFTPDHLAAHPDTLLTLIHMKPRALLLFLRRTDVPDDMRQRVAEEILAYTANDVIPPLTRNVGMVRALTLVVLDAVRAGRLVPTPAIQHHLTAIVANRAISPDLTMAAVLCLETFSAALPEQADEIREHWGAQRDRRRAERMGWLAKRNDGLERVPSLSFETPWESAYATAVRPVAPNAAAMMTTEEVEHWTGLDESTDRVADVARGLLLSARPDDPQFWEALPAFGEMPARYLAAAQVPLHDRPVLAPASVEVYDRLTQAVTGSRRLTDADPYLWIARVILEEHPDTALPLYWVQLLAARRWRSAMITPALISNCPLTPATHELWWQLAECFLLHSRKTYTTVDTIRRTLMGHRLAFPGDIALRQPPPHIVTTLWADGDAELRMMLLEHGTTPPVQHPPVQHPPAQEPQVQEPPVQASPGRGLAR